MSDLYVATNVTQTRISVPGHGGLAPDESVEVEKTPFVEELADSGALRLKPKRSQRTAKSDEEE